jgi:hypothetical protein
MISQKKADNILLQADHPNFAFAATKILQICQTSQNRGATQTTTTKTLILKE